jgi:hypothetical protein
MQIWRISRELLSYFRVESNYHSTSHENGTRPANGRQSIGPVFAVTWPAVLATPRGYGRRGNQGGKSTHGRSNAVYALTVGSTLLKQNGRYIFSFRGGGSSGLDVYDIAANTWISTIAYGNANETFSAGTSSVDYAGNIYIQRDNTGRILRLELDTFSLQTFSAHAYSQGTTVEGCKMFIIPFVDGATTLPFIYTQVHSSNLLLRSMVF